MSNRISQDNLRTWQCGCLDHGGVLAADGRQSRHYAEQLDYIDALCQRTFAHWQRIDDVSYDQAMEFLLAVAEVLGSDRA